MASEGGKRVEGGRGYQMNRLGRTDVSRAVVVVGIRVYTWR